MTEYEIVIRDSENNELVRQLVPTTCVISIVQVESPKELYGWKKRTLLWDNLSDEEKKKMLEHSTF